MVGNRASVHASLEASGAGRAPMTAARMWAGREVGEGRTWRGRVGGSAEAPLQVVADRG